MKRCLALLLLFACGSGCAMIDDLMYEPQPYVSQGPQPGTCYLPTTAASAPQSAEPPLMRTSN